MKYSRPNSNILSSKLNYGICEKLNILKKIIIFRGLFVFHTFYRQSSTYKNIFIYSIKLSLNSSSSNANRIDVLSHSSLSFILKDLPSKMTP